MTNFTDAQKAMLAAPLDRAHVKTRQQAGQNLSYVEGWHVIEEANRVFGFDGWASETVDIKCVADGPRNDKHGVTYIARVRITVGDIVREGVGAGHGIDRDAGRAHESAIKEAETDARKRGLMTFGYCFGLALYDKTQEHVTDGAPESPKRPVEPAPPAPRPTPTSNSARAVAPAQSPAKLSTGKSEAILGEMKRALAIIGGRDGLRAWQTKYGSTSATFAALIPPHKQDIQQAFSAKQAEVMTSGRAAA